MSPPGCRQVHVSLLRGTWGIAVLLIFLCGVAVNKIPPCGVAVISNPAVCDVSVFQPIVFGGTKSFAVLQCDCQN